MHTKLLLAAAIALSASVAWAQIQVIETEVKEVQVNPGDVASWFQIGGGLEGVTPSSHWMGVVVRPLDPLLKRHLRIDGGLVVQDVTKESPAAEAGLQADDILLAVNKIEIADYKALMDFLSENKDEDVTLWYLRDGKKQSAKVKPTKRPEAQIKLFAVPEHAEWNLQGKDPEEIKKWFEKMAKEKWGQALPEGKAWQPDGDNPLKLRFFHPGVILGEDVDVDVEIDLPKGLQIVVMKQGDAPAKIQVKRGDDEWEVTEKDLDKLPEDIRAHVKKYLSGDRGLTIRAVVPNAIQAKPLEARRVVPRIQAQAFRIGGDGEVEKKLDQINERLEKIEKALEKLAEE